MADETTEQIIRASEVGRYAFCARAWWLGSVEGRPSARWREMEAGKVTHRRHGRQVRAASALVRLAWLLLLAAAVVAVVALVRAL